MAYMMRNVGRKDATMPHVVVQSVVEMVCVAGISLAMER